jgi:hypothetical protein
LFLNSFGRGGSAAPGGFVEQFCVIATIVTVIEKDWFAVGMVGEDVDGFSTAVAAESDNSYGDWHLDIYSADCIIIPAGALARLRAHRV